MKFHKFISRTVITTALLGVTFVGTLSGINADVSAQPPDSAPSATIKNDENSNPISPVGQGNSSYPKTKGEFNVNDSSLTLESVPNLTFGDNYNNTNNSSSGSNILPLDNSNDNDNNSNLLEVADYRKMDDQNSNNNWTLSVNMGKVSENSGQSQTNHQFLNQEWKIDLNNNSADKNNLDNSSNLADVSDPTEIYNDNGNNNDYQPVMYNRSHNGYGTNTINYSNKNSAKLTIPNVAPAQYSADINWQLSSNVSEVNNYSD